MYQMDRRIGGQSLFSFEGLYQVLKSAKSVKDLSYSSF